MTGGASSTKNVSSSSSSLLLSTITLATSAVEPTLKYYNINLNIKQLLNEVEQDMRNH